MQKKAVLVMGAGSWGTALAIVLARNNHKVILWDIDTDQIKALQKNYRNDRYLPGIDFPPGIKSITELSDISEDTNDIVIAVPCSALQETVKRICDFRQKDLNICLACKGLASGTHLLNHQVVREFLHERAHVAVLSGPSFAMEVAQGLPTAVTIASDQQVIAEHFAGYFHSEVFRAYTHNDIIGVQIGGAVKNVMAIAAGIADGLGFGANTRTALVTRGLAEIIRFGVELGARQETFMGLAGLGDLVLTCTDDQSRNRRFGFLLAKEMTVSEALSEIKQTVEGVRTIAEVIEIARQHEIEMPISEQVYYVLNGQSTPRDAVQALLSRDPRAEME